jgi:DNA-binding CsgD family transcriptional regulator
MNIIKKKPIFSIDIESMLSLPATVFWKDTHGTYFGCNDVMAELIKLKSRQDVVGLNDNFLLGDNVAEQFIKHDQTVIANSKAMIVNEFFRNEKGILVKGLTTKAPLFDENGQIAGVYGFSYLEEMPDISEKIGNAESLSPREAECLVLLANGFSCKTIALTLNLSKRTVESYLDCAKTKLGCANKYELIIAAIKHNYIELK